MIIRNINQKISLAHEKEKSWVCLKNILPNNIITKIKNSGYKVKTGTYIYNGDEEPYECRDYEFDKYKETCRFRTVIDLYSDSGDGW
jgi:hypothetical protein